MQRPRNQEEQGMNLVCLRQWNERQEVLGNQSERRAAARALRPWCSPWRCDGAECAPEKDNVAQGGSGGPGLGDQVTSDCRLPRGE